MSSDDRPKDAEQLRESIDAYVRGGRPDLAAQMAQHARQYARAAALYERAGMAFEAGVCHFEAGDKRSALASFMLVPSGSPSYRGACLNAIHISSQLGTVTFELDAFLAQFIHGRPTDQGDIDALYKLGVLYQAAGYDDDAREVLAIVARRSPGYADVGGRLTQLDESAQEALTSLLQGDAKFWARQAPASTAPGPTRESSLRPPSFDGLPERPDSRAPPPRTGPQAARPAPQEPRAEGPPRSAPAPRKRSGEMLRRAVPSAGQRVGGRYVLEREIGRGGMSVVFCAQDDELGGPVALKFFDDRQEDGSLLARFKQELKLCRELTHPTIVRVYDIGDHEGRKFITMELLDGVSLKDLIGKLDLERAVYYLHQIAVALGVVHDAGIVHRDVKPANVFITAHDGVKLMDFGIAKRSTLPRKADVITSTGFVAGTVGYMAPEQYAEFASVTPAADIYSLGVIAHEMLTGQRLFPSDNPVEILHAQVVDTIAGPREKNGRVPQRLDALVRRMLTRRAEGRPASCEDIADELVAIARELDGG